MYKTYAYIKFELISPLAVGNGTADETDKDIIRDSKGDAFIPATAFAGVYSRLFNEAERKKYFGFVEIAVKSNQKTQAKESELIVYDGVRCTGDREKKAAAPVYGIRHGVALDEFRTAVEGAKYDFEVIEPGALFWTALEFTSVQTEENAAKEESKAVIGRILAAWKNGELTIGGKSMRGLGRLKTVELKQITFRLPEEKEDWLSFDIYGDRSAMKAPEKGDLLSDTGTKDQISIDLTLKQEGPLTVRVYTTEVSGESKAAPDYCQLSFRKKTVGDSLETVEQEIAVVPGTSWAGVFRHSMISTLKADKKDADAEIAKLFGRVSGEKKGSSIRSKIAFSETYFDDGSSKKAAAGDNGIKKGTTGFITISRNAINRFSGGAADTALFTERMYYGRGEGKLKITVPKSEIRGFEHALAASIADLHEGFLSVGGEASIGHGIFSIVRININGRTLDVASAKADGRKHSGEDVYPFVKECFDGGKENG